jgi:hypothetical protein
LHMAVDQKKRKIELVVSDYSRRRPPWRSRRRGRRRRQSRKRRLHRRGRREDSLPRKGAHLGKSSLHNEQRYQMSDIAKGAKCYGQLAPSASIQFSKAGGRARDGLIARRPWRPRVGSSRSCQQQQPRRHRRGAQEAVIPTSCPQCATLSAVANDSDENGLQLRPRRRFGLLSQRHFFKRPHFEGRRNKVEADPSVEPSANPVIVKLCPLLPTVASLGASVA